MALPATNLGDILLTSGSYEGGAIQTLVAKAVFYPSVLASGCSVAPIAGCRLETCTAQGAPPPALAHAGVIAVGGGLYPLVLQPDQGGVYGPVASTPASDGGPMSLWTGGEELSVASTGGAVPPFNVSVVAPRQLSVATPLPTKIARDADLAFEWSGASAGRVTIDVNATAAATAYYLECKFDVAAGAGSLPKEALAALPAGVGVLTVSSVTRAQVSDGAWTVVALAQTNASGADGVEYTSIVAIP